jgi:ABC-type branched-subunit amino acid transport system ATPase component
VRGADRAQRRPQDDALRSIMGVLRKKTGSIKLRGQDITRLDSH